MKHKLSTRILSTLLAMVMLIGLLPTAAIPVFAEESENEIGEVSDGGVIEVSTWSEFEEAFALSDYSGKSYTIKLMNDLHYDAADSLRSATAIVEVDVNGCFVTLDFNGHTLSCTDDVSSSDFESVLSDFIRINLHPINALNGIEFILTDSVGGGGVTMDSSRAYDNQLAALHVYDTRRFWVFGYDTYSSTNQSCKLTINSGNYTLNAKTEFFGKGTLDPSYDYRGTVIADDLKAVEINGGIFTANGEGWTSDYVNKDMCARELSAFATCTTGSRTTKEDMTGQTVINGGTFISNGYAIHHFDIFKTLGDAKQKLFPMINGGVFSGGIAYIGKTFTYSDGYEEYENKKATDIINNDAYVICIKDGEKYGLEDDLDLRDLHDADSLYILSKSLFELNTLPDVGEITDIERYTEQSDTYQVQYEVPYGITSNQITPYIAVTPTGGTTTTYQTAEKIINYSDYPSSLTVNAGIAVTISGEVLYFENTYNVAVSDLPSPPEILAQPQSMTVAPGECAEAMVVANHAVSYQWYYLYDGSTPMKLTDSLVSALGGGIAGYEDAVLSVKLDGIGKVYFYCVVTGTDGSTVKTNRISFTYGTTPSEKSFDGGEYLANGNAEFKLFANYAETVTWHVAYSQSGSSQIYTLEEFKELTGCEYKTTHKGYLNGLYCATVVFENVDESFSEKYLVGYKMTNSLGSVTVIDPADMVPFTLVEPRPVIQTFIESQSCYEGGRMTFSFSAEDMDYAEWIFEKPDEEGVAVAYDMEEMKELFPEVTFEESLSDNVATLKISNAQTGLYEYMLYAYGGLTAKSCAGSAEMLVIEFTYVRPAGDGSEGNPFQITNICELYWFAGFVNGTITADDITVEPTAVHAKLMNDITVNYDLLTEEGALNDTSGVIEWIPIGLTTGYCGTFDGQGYSISGLYYNTKGYQYEYYGFIARMGENGAVKDLALKDTYFYTEFTGNGTPYAAGIVAFAPEASNRIENCHFDGVVGAESSNRGSVVGGITAVTGGKIQDCTAKGRVLGADSYSGSGKAGGIAGTTYDTAMISDCTNYAEVTCWDSGTGVGYAGGIAGYLAGTVKDCCNQGVINGYNQGNYNYVGGIVGWASGSAEQRAVISRCFNEASFAGSGIVDYIYSSGTYYEGYVTVKNCYNTGSVTNGIVGTAKGVGISITYCHNVGITTKPIIDSIINADDIEMENCYYVETSHYDTDRVEMTEAMLAEEFADGTVLALLDNGHWTQGEDDEYPVLGDAPGVTVSGMVTSFGTESEQTTVQLFPSGSGTPAFSITLTGTHAMYSFEGVEAGTYTMKVSKANHVTREYTVVVGNSPIPLDAKIHLLGDITGDGRINIMDVNRANLHFKKKITLTGYEFACANVTGDAQVNIMDVNRMNLHFKGKSKLW